MLPGLMSPGFVCAKGRRWSRAGWRDNPRAHGAFSDEAAKPLLSPGDEVVAIRQCSYRGIALKAKQENEIMFTVFVFLVGYKKKYKSICQENALSAGVAVER